MRRALIFLALFTAPLAAAEKDTKVYELRVYRAEEGKLDALNARFKNHSMKLLDKHGLKVLGAWTAADTTDRRIVLLFEHKDAATALENWKAFAADADFRKLLAENKDKGPLLEDKWQCFLATTDFSPKIETKSSDKPRVFELRTYFATPKNLDALQARFRDHTVKLFEKHGMTNVAYWTLADGEKIACDMLYRATSPWRSAEPDVKPSEEAKPLALVYMLSHMSTDAAKKSFDAFRQDPAWTAARAESEKKGGGSLTVKDGVKSLFLKPTDYSPMK